MSFRIQAPVVAVTVITAGFLLVSRDVYAYLDPSTGSMVISVIVGIFASVVLAVKTYWYKIKNRFRSGGKRETTPRDRTE